MKNRKVAAYLGIALFALAAGCGTAEEKPPAQAAKAADTELYKNEDADSRDSQPESETPDTTGPSEVSVASGEGDQAGYGDAPDGTDQAPEPSEGYGELETLMGNIKSIEEDFLVVSQAFEEGEDIIVTSVDGSPDESLVTVRVAGDTQYEVKTVKNGGVNGDSDVETRSGSFSDLEKDASVNLRGYYEGDVFVAKEISIYRFL